MRKHKKPIIKPVAIDSLSTYYNKEERKILRETPIECLPRLMQRTYIYRMASTADSEDDRNMMINAMYRAVDWARKSCISREERDARRKKKQEEERQQSLQAIDRQKRIVAEMNKPRVKRMSDNGGWI